MSTEIKVVCAWCDTIITDGPAGKVSHGICGDCLFKQKQILRFRSQCGFGVSELTDDAIWKVYKNTMAMALIRVQIRSDELKKVLKNAGFSAKQLIDGFKKIKEIIDAKNP